jgi:hypothetical protein
MELLEIVAKVFSIGTPVCGVIGFCIKVLIELKKAKEGDLCVLRQLMLEIYYKYKDTKVIPEYEAKNFKLMYDSYKARGGNSFIDEVNVHVSKWELEN